MERHERKALLRDGTVWWTGWGLGRKEAWRTCQHQRVTERHFPDDDMTWVGKVCDDCGLQARQYVADLSEIKSLTEGRWFPEMEALL